MCNMFGPPAGDVDADIDNDPGPPVQGQPKKWRRLEWLEVDSIVTLGMSARNFILHLTHYCKTLDVCQVIQDISSTDHFSVGSSTLLSLTVVHELSSHNTNVTWFWQSMIEIQMALQCERFGHYQSNYLDMWI